jgi:hypothetical protein
MGAGTLAPNVAADYPNHLADPFPQRVVFSRRVGMLAALVLLCLALRIAMALRIPAVNPDSVHYLASARAFDAGNIGLATEESGFNLYPVILMLVHRAGLEWELAGVVWGVVISSLVVLPMFGWAGTWRPD